jgi:adenine-specific DNA-methyltransferase
MGKIVSVASKLRRDRARRLRDERTAAEARLWEALRDRRLEGWKWRRQVPVGPFIVDYACLEAKLVVELDGGIHGERADRDARRDAHLMARGLQVLRFWNTEMVEDFDRVSWTILKACRESDPRRRRAKLARH